MSVSELPRDPIYACTSDAEVLRPKADSQFTRPTCYAPKSSSSTSGDAGSTDDFGGDGGFVIGDGDCVDDGEPLDRRLLT